MLISSTQLAQLGAEARAESEERIFALFREHFDGTPPWPSEEAARGLVSAAIDKAAALGMNATRDAFKFAVMMMVFGPSFDTAEPWAVKILAERAEGTPVAELLYREAIEQVRVREDAAATGNAPAR
ncbi:hypothetical protein [Chondromyces crocatus]|uniref:Uncharacterized protein n=1 Tax=Chondromyces crocatus TaxID=52 RepID=A0A0K1ELH7_CHOCO|nr:hypothetical protein [Chondromyces crocatus]AKT41735.1 uncharacterized protein CMC5_059460 [Chondromyces crocatus]